MSATWLSTLNQHKSDWNNGTEKCVNKPSYSVNSYGTPFPNSTPPTTP